MSDGSIESAVAALNQQVASPAVARAQGAGKAYQSVAQSTAIAVQDATDYLRSISIIAATTVAVASAKMIETESTSPWSNIITEAQKTVDTAAATFTQIGLDAGQVLSKYPSGD